MPIPPQANLPQANHRSGWKINLTWFGTNNTRNPEQGEKTRACPGGANLGPRATRTRTIKGHLIYSDFKLLYLRLITLRKNDEEDKGGAGGSQAGAGLISR